MKLYDRDFNDISEDEKKEWEAIKEKEKVIIDGKSSELIKNNLYSHYPKAVRHFLSLFPNNHLDAIELKNEAGILEAKLKEFIKVIDNINCSERDILNWVKNEKGHFIIGSLLKNYQFGHHSIYVFPEFKLPPNYQVDFLIIGKNSDGHHFVFVELENTYGKITMGDGSFGETIRKGINQIDDWEKWLEENFSHLRLVFEGALGKSESLPKEFTVFDKSRIHFVVVGGRRTDYDEKTYRLRRTNLEQRKLQILHYDNLIDLANETIGGYTY
jgi:hypothetical protein